MLVLSLTTIAQWVEPTLITDEAVEFLAHSSRLVGEVDVRLESVDGVRRVVGRRTQRLCVVVDVPLSRSVVLLASAWDTVRLLSKCLGGAVRANQGGKILCAEALGLEESKKDIVRRVWSKAGR